MPKFADVWYWPKMTGSIRKQRIVRIVPGGFRDLQELLGFYVDQELDRRYGAGRERE